MGDRRTPPGLRPIGVIHREFRDPDATPVQAALSRDAEGPVELDPELSDALDGLSGFDSAWILTWPGGSTIQSPARRSTSGRFHTYSLANLGAAIDPP